MNYAKNLPLNDDVLLHTNVLKMLQCLNLYSFFFLFRRYSHLHLLLVPTETPLLQEEFVAYPFLNDSDIPESEWKGDSESKFFTVDSLYGFISTMTITVSSESSFNADFK